MVAYECDPKKNKECKKTFCYMIGGECRMTTHKEYSTDGKPIFDDDETCNTGEKNKW